MLRWLRQRLIRPATLRWWPSGIHVCAPRCPLFGLAHPCYGGPRPLRTAPRTSCFGGHARSHGRAPRCVPAIVILLCVSRHKYWRDLQLSGWPAIWEKAVNALLGLFRSAIQWEICPRSRQPTTASPPGVNSWDAGSDGGWAEATAHMILARRTHSTLPFRDRPQGWRGRVAAGSRRVERRVERVAEKGG